MGKAKWVADDSVEGRRRRLAHLLALGAVRAAKRPREPVTGTETGEARPAAECNVAVSNTI